MEGKFNIGDKVKPIKKSSRGRDFDNCATYYKRIELKQDFLYITGYDEISASKIGEMSYWCDVIPYGTGDSYSESDLILIN